MQQFLVLPLWKQWKVAVLYHLPWLQGKLKREISRAQLFLRWVFFPVASTVVSETMSD